MTSTEDVLFFGKCNCKYSQQACEYLQDLGFQVRVVWSKTRSEPLPEDINWWHGEYILCFRSYFVLPKSLIDRATIAAINFHPAPTEYPGSGCLNWALYDDAKSYGVTAHIMNEKVDNGPVVECRRFPVLSQDNVKTLLARTHHKAFDLIIDIATGLKLEGRAFLNRKLEESKNEQWRGRARKMQEIDELQKVPLACTKNDLERIIRATYTPDHPPEVTLHGYKFVLRLGDCNSQR